MERGPDDDDWRLAQSKTFEGATWHRRRYFIWSDDWSHDHCAFCWRSFDVPGSAAAAGETYGATEGWASEDEYHWVCEECFNDFRTRFRWQTRDAAPTDRPDTPADVADRVVDAERENYRPPERRPPES